MRHNSISVSGDKNGTGSMLVKLGQHKAGWIHGCLIREIDDKN